MTDEPVDFYERLMLQVPEMQEAMRALDQERDTLIRTHQAQLAVVDEKKKTLRKLLNALGTEEPARSVRRQVTSANGRAPVSHAVLTAIIDAILEQGNGLFTALGVHERAGTSRSQPHTYAAFTYLRTHEVIAKTGARDENGREFWRMLPGGVELAEKLKQQQRSRSVGRPERGREAPPTPDHLQRVLRAIGQVDRPDFTALEIAQALGLASASSIYHAFRYLHSIGYLEPSGFIPGATTPGGRMRPRKSYRIANADALTDSVISDILNAEEVDA